jgi:hypothetical protein
MSDPAAPIVRLAETQLQIQAATANGRDALAVGVLGVDTALGVAAIPLRSVLGHDWWQPVIAIGVSGLLALVALLQGGVDMELTPVKAYVRLGGLTEEGVSLGLIDILDRTIETTDRRLQIKTWILTGSLMTIVMALIVTFAGR